MKIKLVPVITLTLAALLPSCAAVKVTKLVSDATYVDGIRFYRGLPYLAVVGAGDQCSATIVYLPDKRQEYVARTTPGLGSVNLTAKLEGGLMLTEFGASSDSKAAEIAVAVIAGMAALGKGVEQCPTGLYGLGFDEKTGRVNLIEKINLGIPTK